MALAARRDARTSVAEYRVRMENRPEAERWELLDGLPVRTPRPIERHPRLVANLPCRIVDLADRRDDLSTLPGLMVPSGTVDDQAPFPDVLVRPAPGRRCRARSSAGRGGGRARDPGERPGQGRCRPHGAEPADLPDRLPERGAGREAWQRGRDFAMQVFGTGDRIDLPELGGAVAVADNYARVAF